MIRLRAVSHLQQFSHSKTGASEPTINSPLLSGARPSHGPAAGTLYPKPNVVSRLTSQFSRPAELFARAKNLASQRTWNGTFSVHTRVGCIHSPLNDLPPGVAKPGKKISEKQQRKQAFASNQLQRSTVAARAQATAGLFREDKRGETALPSTQAHSSMHEAVDLIASLFPQANDRQFCQLQQSLHSLDLPPQTDRTTLAYALASASDGNIMIAEKTLARLSKGIVLTDMRHCDGSGEDAEITQRAYKVAKLLSQNDVDLSILQALHPEHADFGRAASVVLQSALLDAHTDRASLASRAHSAALHMLKPDAKLTDAEKAAIFAWEQGFRSDGEGSPLRAVQRQLGRFANKTIPRVEQSRFTTFIPRLCGRKKSPLVALCQGMHGANRPSLVKEREKVRDAMQATVGHLLSDVLQDPAAILREDDPVGALASLATLSYWAGRPNSYPGQRMQSPTAPGWQIICLASSR